MPVNRRQRQAICGFDKLHSLLRFPSRLAENQARSCGAAAARVRSARTWGGGPNKLAAEQSGGRRRRRAPIGLQTVGAAATRRNSLASRALDARSKAAGRAGAWIFEATDCFWAQRGCSSGSGSGTLLVLRKPARGRQARTKINQFTWRHAALSALAQTREIPPTRAGAPPIVRSDCAPGQHQRKPIKHLRARFVLAPRASARGVASRNYLRWRRAINLGARRLGFAARRGRALVRAWQLALESPHLVGAPESSSVWLVRPLNTFGPARPARHQLTLTQLPGPPK